MPRTSFTLGDVMNEIRDLHGSFDAKVHPRPVLVRACVREQERLYGLCVEEDAAWPFTTSDELDVTAAYDPIELPANRGVLAVRAVVRDQPDGARADVKLTSFGGRDDPHFVLSAYASAEHLHLNNTPGAWSQIRGVFVDYMAGPVVLVEDGHKFTLPDAARPALVYRVALMLAARNPANIVVPRDSIAQWKEDAQKAEERMMANAGGQGLVRLDTIRNARPE